MDRFAGHLGQTKSQNFMDRKVTKVHLFQSFPIFYLVRMSNQKPSGVKHLLK